MLTANTEGACKVCREPFLRLRSTQTVCSVRCAAKVPKIALKAEIQARKVTRAQREAVKPRGKWMAEAQAVVNRYCRLRDRDLPCVSCDRPATWDGQWHASHFRSVGACTNLRFNLWNIHKACSICNNWKSGNLSEYEPRLRERIGNERVDWLRQQNGRVVFSVDYLRRLKSVFAKKVKRLERRMQ